METDYHEPVLLEQCVQSLNISPDSCVLDATFGAGGHSKKIFKKLGVKGHLYAFDQDKDAIANALDEDNFTLINANYRHVARYMKLFQTDGVDAILADLGISSHQIDVPERGFSFRYDADLDMRMNASGGFSAQDLINGYDEAQLTDVFSAYGEVRNSKSLARKIVADRKGQKIVTTMDLNRILEEVAMGQKHKYLAQVYQAIRIEVNDEMGALKQFLTDATKLLKPGGRFVVLSYHSLEDRLIKNLFKKGNVEGKMVQDEFGRIERPFKMVNKKIIVPDSEEQKRNPRSRSAKLRIAEKI